MGTGSTTAADSGPRNMFRWVGSRCLPRTEASRIPPPASARRSGRDPDGRPLRRHTGNRTCTLPVGHSRPGMGRRRDPHSTPLGCSRSRSYCGRRQEEAPHRWRVPYATRCRRWTSRFRGPRLGCRGGRVARFRRTQHSRPMLPGRAAAGQWRCSSGWSSVRPRRTHRARCILAIPAGFDLVSLCHRVPTEAAASWRDRAATGYGLAATSRHFVLMRAFSAWSSRSISRSRRSAARRRSPDSRACCFARTLA